MGKKLLLWIDNAALYRDALARAGIADQLDIEDVAMAAQASDAQLAATELMLTWTVPPGTLDRMPRLEWIQTPNTGVAAWLKRPDLRPGIQLSCGRGIHRVQMPENIQIGRAHV